MKKNNSFDDIIPPKKTVTKRSIRDIPLPEKKQNKIDELLKETEEYRAEHHHHEENHVPVRPSASSRPIYISKNRKSSKTWMWILLVVIIIAISSLFYFNDAEVTITLKTETIPIDITTTSATETAASTSSLPYKVLPVQKTATREVVATGAATKVEKKASGTIIVYNNYNASPQQLIATTRFETSDGLVYRLDKAVTVPGTSIKNGKTVPGSVEAVVSADVTGTKYNIEKTDFTIPGFKGTAKYEGFYARSKTSMTGGFSGTMPQISDADLKTANDDLKQTLTDEALAEVKNQSTAEQVFFKDGGVRTSYTYEISPSTTGKAKVTGKVTVEALIFERSKVEENIAVNRNGEKYHFDNLDSLTVTIQNASGITSFISEPVLSLKFTGTLTTGQSFDVQALQSALADKSKNQLQEILKMYPEITQAEAVIRPFWSRSFPNNSDKIEIVVTKQ